MSAEMRWSAVVRARGRLLLLSNGTSIRRDSQLNHIHSSRISVVHIDQRGKG